MADDPTKTSPARHDSRAEQDPRGRNVWAGRVEEAPGLELVSTVVLEKIMTGSDGQAKAEIRELAGSGQEGLLARDGATGHYKIVEDGAMQRAGELSLVNTMMLRKVVGADGKPEIVAPAREEPKAPEQTGRDQFGGFDPYNRS